MPSEDQQDIVPVEAAVSRTKAPGKARTVGNILRRPAASYPDELREWKAKKRVFDLGEQSGFPPHVKEALETVRASKDGSKRDSLRNIVESSVQLQENGKYKLVINNPTFEEWRGRYEKKYGQQMTIGDTRTFAANAAGGHKCIECVDH